MNEIIWQSTLDGVWRVQVTRKDERHGVLTIEAEDRPERLQEEVTLDYGAAFGPDVADVVQWQSRAIAFVDGVFHAQPLKAGD